ncbi:MAG: CHAT domain-containing protein [Oscillospiraceae bacterium]|nr:CHAT domain-containing protein [Oscillospiraceae bacterium]
MPIIDTYRNNLLRKRDELSKLSSEKSRASEKRSQQKQKIISASNAIKRTSSQSTVRTKTAEIERAEKEIASIDKSIAELDKKIAQKEKEIAAEERKINSEEEKIRKRQLQEDKKRQQENERTLKKLNQAIETQKKQQEAMMVDIDALKAVPETITVLFFATNPKGTSQLRLDEEARSIQEMIRKSEHRDSISFVTRWAVRPLDILQAINEINPDVIHFSGHGAVSGDLILENTDGSPKPVTKEAITQTIMSSSDKIHLLFFNACFSYEQAQEIVQHVDAAIGMTTSIGDEAACTFAAQFYSSLGFGHSLKKAFEQAKGAMMLVSPTEADTPALYTKEGIDADTTYIVRPAL